MEISDENIKTLGVAHVVVNTIFLIVGLLIVWHSTHNWFAMGGAFVAAIHIDIRRLLK